MKLKKFMLSALILVFAVGCVNHSGQSASGFDETYYPSVYDELLELDRIDRVEGFILGRDPDYDEKKIFTEPDEVKQFIDVLKSMSIKARRMTVNGDLAAQAAMSFTLTMSCC